MDMRGITAKARSRSAADAAAAMKLAGGANTKDKSKFGGTVGLMVAVRERHVVDGGVLVLAPPAPHRLWLVLGLLGADGTLGALVTVLPRGPVVPAAHTLRNALTTK